MEMQMQNFRFFFDRFGKFRKANESHLSPSEAINELQMYLQRDDPFIGFSHLAKRIQCIIQTLNSHNAIRTLTIYGHLVWICVFTNGTQSLIYQVDLMRSLDEPSSDYYKRLFYRIDRLIRQYMDSDNFATYYPH